MQGGYAFSASSLSKLFLTELPQAFTFIGVEQET